MSGRDIISGLTLLSFVADLAVLEARTLKMFGGQTILVICLAVMVICLAFEGVILAFEGFPYYEHLSPLVYILGLVWALTVGSCFVFRRWPFLSVAGGGTILLINGISLWRSDPETHQSDWFLYMHSVELLFLAASCVGAFSKWRSRTVQMERRP
jgi:hypothetical protein